MKVNLRLALLGVVALVAALPTAELSTDVALPVTQRGIAACGSNPPSGKRGVAYNDPKYTGMFKGTNSKVNWMYNWASSSPSSTPNTGHTYVPLLHSTRGDHTGPWFSNVDFQVNHFCSYNAMSFNEPDNCQGGAGGSCLSVGDAIAGYKQWMQPLADKYPQVKLGAPAVTNGAWDGSKPMGLNYLKAFLDGCSGCRIDFVVIHWYNREPNVEYFKQHVQNAYDTGGHRPVWITEFRPTGSQAQIIDFLKQVMPWLDSQTYVHRYAYFMAAPGDADNLIRGDGNGLSAIGEVYNSY